ncbi:uncharacterized protein LW93_7517 [Fusarium fujikuroi]|nr:uncharacterized protein LW93_7517 [Fusarium fujikuroi]
MATNQIGPVARAWYRWKALRLPWRKRFLVGYDLQGNTYWEFRLTRGAESNERWRRIVKYPRSTHYSSVKVSPQWHQWLRHTREDPPSIEEQHSDVLRQVRMQKLAAEADARWEAKPRVMDAPQAARRRLRRHRCFHRRRPVLYNKTPGVVSRPTWAQKRPRKRLKRRMILGPRQRPERQARRGNPLLGVLQLPRNVEQ